MSDQAVSYKKFGFPIAILVLGALILILGGFLWGLCTYTVRPEHVGIVFNKRGKSDPAGHFIGRFHELIMRCQMVDHPEFIGLPGVNDISGKDQFRCLGVSHQPG